MKFTGVHSVFFFVADLERSKAFYQQVLGLAPAYEASTIASFRLGNVELMLHADGSTPRVPAGSKRGAGFALHLQVEGIHAFWEHLQSSGIQLGEKPTQQPYGVTEFSLHDPDGYEVEFVEPVPAPR